MSGSTLTAASRYGFLLLSATASHSESGCVMDVKNAFLHFFVSSVDFKVDYKLEGE